jgi:hypothetical protein
MISSLDLELDARAGQQEMSVPGDPWLAGTVPPPSLVGDAELLLWLVRYAVLAPSSHNTQPWLFVARDGALELRADRTRGLPVVDPHDRELVISCGAALGILRVAANRAGRDLVVQRLPDDGDPDLLARVRLAGRQVPQGPVFRRFAAISRRRTVRRGFEARPIDPEVLESLGHTATAEGAWLAVVDDLEGREQVASLVADADRRQAADAAFRRELAMWIHPNHTRSRDGMPGYAFAMSDLVSYAGPFFVRTFHWGDRQAARDHELAVGSPVLAVLGTADDTPRDWIIAGEALAMVLLDATAAGLRTAFLNQPVEVVELRPALRRLVAGRTGQFGAPQLVLRLGYGPEAAPTPRRPANEVTTRE